MGSKGYPKILDITDDFLELITAGSMNVVAPAISVAQNEWKRRSIGILFLCSTPPKFGYASVKSSTS